MSFFFPVALILSLPVAFAGPPDGVRWIAHRGGVVDPSIAENSSAAVEAAIARGYFMIETDIRETSDGHAVVHHDPDFRRVYGDSRKVSEMTLAEIKRLRATPGGAAPMTFEELAALCRGRIRFMLDIKGDHAETFYRGIEDSLRRHDLLSSAYMIGHDTAGPYFRGKLRVSRNWRELQQDVAQGVAVNRLFFLFEWGKNLTESQIQFARKHAVAVVPSINTFHYGGNAGEAIREGSTDIRRLRSLGVAEFQIDSVLEPAFAN